MENVKRIKICPIARSPIVLHVKMFRACGSTSKNVWRNVLTNLARSQPFNHFAGAFESGDGDARRMRGLVGAD